MLAIVIAVCVLTVVAVLWTIGIALRLVVWLASWAWCVWLAVRLERSRTPAQRAAWMRDWEQRRPPHVAGGS